MESYKLLIFLHVLFVTVGLGVTFAFPFLQAVAERSGTMATRIALQASEKIESYVVIPGNILLFIAGLGLIFDDATGYKDDFPTWLMIALPIYLVTFAVALVVQRPTAKAALRSLEGHTSQTLPAAYEPLSKKMQMVGGMMSLSMVVVMFLMVWKPGA